MNAKEFMEASKKYDEEIRRLTKEAPPCPTMGMEMLFPNPDGINRIYVDPSGVLKLRLGIYEMDGIHGIPRPHEWHFTSPESARELAKFILEMYPEETK